MQAGLNKSRRLRSLENSASDPKDLAELLKARPLRELGEGTLPKLRETLKRKK